jgi:hypothetical protein
MMKVTQPVLIVVRRSTPSPCLSFVAQRDDFVGGFLDPTSGSHHGIVMDRARCNLGQSDLTSPSERSLQHFERNASTKTGE